MSTPRQTLCLSYYKENLPEPANLVNLIANWDVLKIQNRFRDAAGCLLSYDEDVIAGPNVLSRGQLIMLTQHILSLSNRKRAKH